MRLHNGTTLTVHESKVVINRSKKKAKVVFLIDPKVGKGISIKDAVELENILIADFEKAKKKYRMIYNLTELKENYQNEEEEKPLISENNILGYCPTCGSPVIYMEKCPDGNCWCAEDHMFPFKDVLKENPNASKVEIIPEKPLGYCPICSFGITSNDIVPLDYVCSDCGVPAPLDLKGECFNCGSEESYIKKEESIICSEGHEFPVEKMLEDPIENNESKEVGSWLCPCGYVMTGGRCSKCGEKRNHPDVKPFPLNKKER